MTPEEFRICQVNGMVARELINMVEGELEKLGIPRPVSHAIFRNCMSRIVDDALKMAYKRQAELN